MHIGMSADASGGQYVQHHPPMSKENAGAVTAAANGSPAASHPATASNGATAYDTAAVTQPATQPQQQQPIADTDMATADMPPLQPDPSIATPATASSGPPTRPSITFSIRNTQPRKRRQPMASDSASSDLQQIVKQAKVDAADSSARTTTQLSSATSYRPPSAADHVAHAAARERLRVQMQAGRERSAPSSSSTSSSPSGSSSGSSGSEAVSRASRLLTSGDTTAPLPPTALVYYMAENEKAKMQSRYQALVQRRTKEKEQQAKDARSKQPPIQSPPSLLARLADECLQMNVSSHFPTGKDSRGVDTFTSTRFRGGSAIDSLLARDAQAAVSGQPAVGWQVSFTLCMYQHGFSINSEDSNWQEYNDTNLQMLAAIDNGDIPPYLTTLAPSLNLTFYDGHLIVEVRDYRNVQLSMGQKEPKVRRLLLRPTQESLIMDVKQCIAESGIHDGSEWAELAAEAEVVRLVRSRLCLWNSVRVCQVLNLATMNRAKGAALRVSGDVADERTMELWETMGETMFGLDVPTVEEDEERKEEEARKVREKEKEKEDEDEQKVAQLLRRGTVMSQRVREKLTRLQVKQEEARARARKDLEVMTQRLKQEERLEEEEDERIKTQQPAIKQEATALVASSPLLHHDPLPPHISSPAPSHFLPLLAYAAFCSQTATARHNAAANVLLLDPEARRRELSGPQGQALRAQAAYTKAMEQYRKEAATATAGSTNTASLQPPQYKKPLTIVSKVDPIPLQDRTLKNPSVLPVDEWTQYSFTSPISGRDREGKTVTSLLSMTVDVYVHAIPAPPCGSLPALASGRYECYVRQTVVGAGEALGVPQCVAEGSKDEIRVFVREYVRCLQREGGLQAGKETVVTGKRPIRLPSDNVMREVEERGERMKQLDEHLQAQRQAQQAAAQAQAAAAAQQAAQSALSQPQSVMGAGSSPVVPQMNGAAGVPPSAAAVAAAAGAAPGGRRHPAGKQPAGAASSLGLPSSYTPSQVRRDEVPPAASSRMPAGYYGGGVSGMRPGGGAGNDAGVAAASSPPPLQQGNSTPPATFPPPAVPPPYHAHHPQVHQPSRSVPGHPPTAAPNAGQQPGAQPMLTPDQLRVREQQQRALQQQRYQQQLLRQQQQAAGYPPSTSSAPSAASLGPPSTGSLSPRSQAAYGRSVSPQPPPQPQPHQQQPQTPVSPSRDYRAGQQSGAGMNMTQQQYAEYQQRKLMMQQQQQQQQQQQHHRGAANGQQLDPRAQQQQPYGGGGGQQRYTQEQLMALQQQRDRERQHQQQQQQHPGYPPGYPQAPMAHSPNPAGPPHMQPQAYTEQQRR